MRTSPPVTQGTTRSRRRPAGFTLLELLITVAIIGLIMAILIPNFLDSLQKSKQKRTMAEIHETGKAMMAWLTGEIGAAAAGSNAVDLSAYGSQITIADLEALLVPTYISRVPTKDGWGNPFEYYLNQNDLLAARVMAIRSPGRDGSFAGSNYTFDSFVSTDYDQDLVWADGVFIRWPTGAQ